MKLVSTQLSIVTIFAWTLTPISVFSHSLNRPKSIEHPHLRVLAQVASYRYLVDAANKEEKLANLASANFVAAFQQLSKTSNRDRVIKITNVLIQTSDRAAAHLKQSSELGLQSLPYYAADPSAQTALDTTYRIQLEMAQIFRNYNQLSIQTRSAARANDGAKVQVLATKFTLLDEQRSQLIQLSQQVARDYINRSNAANARSIVNLNTQMRNGIIQRSQATKCMVSNLPYGSPAQIANNASGYCNSP